MRVLVTGQVGGVRRSVRRILELRGHTVVEAASLPHIPREDYDGVFAALPLHGGNAMDLHGRVGTVPMVALAVSVALVSSDDAGLFLDIAERAQGTAGIEDLIEVLEIFAERAAR